MELMRHRFATGVVVCLLALVASACERSPTGANDHTLGEVRVIDLDQSAADPVATWMWNTGWAGSLPEISLATGQPIRLGVRIFSRRGDERVLQLGGEYSARWSLALNAPENVIATTDAPGTRFRGDHVHIHGSNAGTTSIQFELAHGDHVDGATTPIPVRVVD